MSDRARLPGNFDEWLAREPFALDDAGEEVTDYLARDDNRDRAEEAWQRREAAETYAAELEEERQTEPQPFGAGAGFDGISAEEWNANLTEPLPTTTRELLTRYWRGTLPAEPEAGS